MPNAYVVWTQVVRVDKPAIPLDESDLLSVRNAGGTGPRPGWIEWVEIHPSPALPRPRPQARARIHFSDDLTVADATGTRRQSAGRMEVHPALGRPIPEAGVAVAGSGYHAADLAGPGYPTGRG
jgi:hypothetical protein